MDLQSTQVTTISKVCHAEERFCPEASLRGRFPFFFDILKLLFKPLMTIQYPDRWNIEWLKLDRDVVGLNCRSCFYLDGLTEYGCPELTPHFCRLDDLLAAEAAGECATSVMRV
jgi:hypothetical protein